MHDKNDFVYQRLMVNVSRPNVNNNEMPEIWLIKEIQHSMEYKTYLADKFNSLIGAKDL